MGQIRIILCMMKNCRAPFCRMLSVMGACTCAVLVCCLVLTVTSAGKQNVRIFSIQGSDFSRLMSTNRVRVSVSVNVQQSLNTISSHFVGVTLDARLILINWSTLDFRSKKVQNMAKALAPSYFRLGGMHADAMTYVLNTKTDTWNTEKFDLGDRRKRHAKVYLTAKDYDAVNQFSKTVGWDFIMDLNALKRYSNGSWNPDNARQLLQYSADRNFAIAGFELGNQYDIYQKAFGVTVSPEQLARDVGSLKSLLSQFPLYSNSFIVGPEISTKVTYYKKFLAAGGSQVVRAASFHQYYFAGPRARISDFLSVSRMEELGKRVDTIMDNTRSVDPLLPVWLSETSSAYNSGTPNISDRFVAGFLWLDKLGVCASKGIQTVIRQAFYGGHYSLVNADLDPNPDFWLTVLYKRLVWGAVFNATATSHIRVYAACANPQYNRLGSVTVYMLNPNNHSMTLDLPQFRGHRLLVYSLTPGDNLGLLSKYTMLNGVRLKLEDDQVPQFLPQTVYGEVSLDAYSFMFVVVDDARADICMERP